MEVADLTARLRRPEPGMSDNEFDDLLNEWWGAVDQIDAELAKAERRLREGEGSELEVANLKAWLATYKADIAAMKRERRR